MVSNVLALFVRYQEFSNVSDKPTMVWKNPKLIKPITILSLLRIRLITNGAKLPKVPNIPPIDVSNQRGFVA